MAYFSFCFNCFLLVFLCVYGCVLFASFQYWDGKSKSGFSGQLFCLVHEFTPPPPSKKIWAPLLQNPRYIYASESASPFNMYPGAAPAVNNASIKDQNTVTLSHSITLNLILSMIYGGLNCQTGKYVLVTIG